LGFALAGVCRPDPSRWGDELRRWLNEGRHGDMGYMAEQVEKRLDVARLFEEVAPGGPPPRAVLMVADQYAPRGGDDERPRPGRGRIARYARGRDYHRTIKRRLHRLADELRAAYPGSAYRSFVDTAPVLERELAVRCGLGWQAKNTMVIHPRLGSWLLLGGMVTSLHLEPPPEQPSWGDHCGSCTRCIDACPTNAITPWHVDATRCVSYLTIERRGPVDEALMPGVGDWIYGCDVCQEVCPHNSPRETPADAVHPAYAPRTRALDLPAVLGWGEPERREAFAVSALKRARLDMMKRNALIVLGNQLRERPDAAVLARVRRVADDPREPELVRVTARAVLRRLSGG
jgi:epoxyqueuosine reductase